MSSPGIGSRLRASGSSQSGSDPRAPSSIGHRGASWRGWPRQAVPGVASARVGSRLRERGLRFVTSGSSQSGSDPRAPSSIGHSGASCGGWPRQAVPGVASYRGGRRTLRWRRLRCAFRPGAGAVELTARPEGRSVRPSTARMRTMRALASQGALRRQGENRSRPRNRPRRAPPAAEQRSVCAGPDECCAKNRQCERAGRTSAAPDEAVCGWAAACLLSAPSGSGLAAEAREKLGSDPIQRKGRCTTRRCWNRL